MSSVLQRIIELIVHYANIEEGKKDNCYLSRMLDSRMYNIIIMLIHFFSSGFHLLSSFVKVYFLSTLRKHINKYVNLCVWFNMINITLHYLNQTYYLLHFDTYLFSKEPCI